MNRKPLSKEEFDQIYSKVPRLCVEVVVQTDKGIVLTKRSIEPFKNFWHLPGERFYLERVLKMQWRG